MLEFPKISLRKVQPSDVDIILKWENNPSHWEVSNTKEMFAKSDIENFVNQKQDITENNQLRLIICNNNTPVGCVDLFEYDVDNQKAGVGILIDEEYQGQGFATKALSLLIGYCRNELSIVHLFCNVKPNNMASIRLFEKLKFKLIHKAELYGSLVNYYEREC